MTRTQRDMQRCIPYVKALADKEADKEYWKQQLLLLGKDSLISLLAILEIGRDSFMADMLKPKPGAETAYGKHRGVTKRQQERASKESLVNNILTKLLLHRYMETAYVVLSLGSLDDANLQLEKTDTAEQHEMEAAL